MTVPLLKPIKILLGTANSKKAEEISNILAPNAIFQFLTLKEFPDVPEPEETGSTFAQNAELKARYYNQLLGLPTLADDSGLCVDALNGAPGVYSARYGINDDARISRLLQELQDSSLPRTAHFACSMYFVGDSMKFFSSYGQLNGRILTEKAGNGGFGYDPVFCVDDKTGTSLAQLTPQQKNAVSHRSRALAGIVPQILAWARTLNEPLEK